MTQPATTSPTDFDVVVIGGAFSGSSTALLLKRALPEARVLVIEGRDTFPHKVGEATVEVSGLFLHRVLGQYSHLSRRHLPKHGLRYWFSDGQGRSLGEMAEAGPLEGPRVPSFQLDRSVLDQHLLDEAEEQGAMVLRPARCVAVSEGWPASTLTLEHDGDERTVTTRWIVDASGRQSFLGRRKRLLERLEDHPIAASWGRWQGVLDLDGPAFQPGPGREAALPEVVASRRLATNHFCGRGWWCWVIPLSNGKTSIGVVYDKRLFSLPGDGNLKSRYESFVRSRDGLRELVAEARLDHDDASSYSFIPYCSRQYMDRGWALVGDAAAFLDPYYSPGLDHCAISVYATADLIRQDLTGELSETALLKSIVLHNEAFERSYRRWFEALYAGKYQLFGDAELTTCAFLVDTALYYLGVVTPAYRNLESLKNPVFGAALPQARWAYRSHRAFGRRLQTLAKKKLALGTYGRRNVGWRMFTPSIGIGTGALAPLRRGLRLWLSIELQTLFGRARSAPVTRDEAKAVAPDA